MLLFKQSKINHIRIMTTDTENDIDMFLSQVREQLVKGQRPTARKLEACRDLIMAGVAADLPITAIRRALVENRGMEVGYTNLLQWIRKQQKASKSTKASGKKTSPKESPAEARTDLHPTSGMQSGADQIAAAGISTSREIGAPGD